MRTTRRQREVLNKVPELLAESANGLTGDHHVRTNEIILAGGSAVNASWYAEGSYAIAVAQDEISSDVFLWFSSGLDARGRLRAMWHACVLRHFMESTKTSCNLEKLYHIVGESWPCVENALEVSGWDLNLVHLNGAEGWLTRK